MARFNINYTGVPANLQPRIEQIFRTISIDPVTNILIDNRTSQVTILFDHVGVGVEKALARVTGGNTTTFNLDELASRLSDGEVVFDTGAPGSGLIT